MIGYSYDEKNADVEDENNRESFMKLHRIKRDIPSNITFVNYAAAPFMNLLPPLMNSTPPIITDRTANISLTYVITSFGRSVTTTQITQFINPINSTTTYSVTSTTKRPTRLNTTSSYNPDTCYNSSFIKLVNGTCVQKFDAQIISIGILRNSSRSTNDTIQALSLYISSITNSTRLSNQTNTLSIDDIEHVVNNISNINLTINCNTSFLTIQQPHQDDNIIVLGASFKRGIGGEIVDTTNKDNITHSFLSAAAIVSEASLDGVVSLNLLIIDKPTGYENADNITTKILASSVIVANLQRNSSTYNSVTISLYFNPVEEYKQNDRGKYLCSFYDTTNSQWNESGCSQVYHNQEFNRYECNCSHLTSFALIWLPQSLLTNGTKTFRATDIASLVFQSISILCFLAIIIHAIGVRNINPSMRVQTLKLLPLISTATTTILFIFYIALGMTVYTQTLSSDETECFLSSKVLMFTTYFLLIYMFCVKTSAGYFYYLRFVRLFPHPSHRQLLLMLIISFSISLLCVLLAIGISTKSTSEIIQLYPYKLCWFTRDVIYYFLTIPIGIFLLLNIITITLVSRSIITHALNAATSEQINERMKRCVLVLLSSCVTQGIGWLFGPFISFINPIAGNILEWFFIILNGLEGFWSIVLYLLIRSQQMYEQKHISATTKLSKSVGISSNKENDGRTIEKNTRKERLYSFNDLRKREADVSNDYGDREFN